MGHHSYTVVVIIALIALAIYRRVRRNIGWQRFRKGSLLFRTVLLLVIGLLFLSIGFMHPISLISDIVGIIIGAVLAYYGVSLTSFEDREGRTYYRPNIWIGSLVTVIFLGRFIYRFYGLFAGGNLASLQQGQPNGSPNMASTLGNPWTTGLMLIMFAYYVIYYIVLLKKQNKLLQTED